MSSPGRAGDIQSSPRAGGAGRANSARLDGRAQVRPARHKQANNFLLRRVPRTNSGIARCSRNRCREPLQIEQKALTKMLAVARNIDFVGVSEKAPASAFAWVAVRVRIICCYASVIPRPICEALAELFSCRPHRAPNVCSTLRYFPPPKPRVARQCTCDSSARRLLKTASVKGRRTVVHPMQDVHSASDTDDNWTALCAPHAARSTDLGISGSLLIFIQ